MQDCRHGSLISDEMPGENPKNLLIFFSGQWEPANSTQHLGAKAMDQLPMVPGSGAQHMPLCCAMAMTQYTGRKEAVCCTSIHQSTKLLNFNTLAGLISGGDESTRAGD